MIFGHINYDTCIIYNALDYQLIIIKFVNINILQHHIALIYLNIIKINSILIQIQLFMHHL